MAFFMEIVIGQETGMWPFLAPSGWRKWLYSMGGFPFLLMETSKGACYCIWCSRVFPSMPTSSCLGCPSYLMTEGNQLWFEASTMQNRVGKNLILDDIVEFLDLHQIHQILDHLLFKRVIFFWFKSPWVGISAAFPWKQRTVNKKLKMRRV